MRLKQENLHDLIAKSGLTQNHWAIKLGLSRGHWSGIVNGRHPFPSARTRERLLEAFNVPFENLFEVEPGPVAWSDQNFQAAISDRYVIDREVGQGGMGTVFLARDIKLGRSVAIKVLSPEVVSGIGLDQFMREVRYTARLQHHNVVPLHDADQALGSPYYVMPFYARGSLRQLVEAGPLSVKKTLRVVRAVGAALHHAHAKQILHCDIKPENVLISEDQHVLVADFGIARAIHAEALEWGQRQSIDSSAGTPAYVSPEAASGEPTLDARADVYSLGCMAFEMLCGQPPFQGGSALAVVARRFTDEVPSLTDVAPHVPVGIARVVSKAMELPPQRRQQTVSEFVEAFEEASRVPDKRVVATVSQSLHRLTRLGRKILGLAPVNLSERSKVRRMIDHIRQDVGYAVRTLRRAPGFSALVVLTLAFGIAANTVVFSLLNPYFVRPLPFADPDRLVHVGRIDPVSGNDRVRFSVPQRIDFAERSEGFSAFALYRYGYVNLTGVEGPERTMAGTLSPNTFEVLGVAAAMGRVFTETDGVGSGEAVVVIGDGLWKRRYGSAPDIVGRPLAVDGVPHTIIGVTDRLFNFPFGEVELWVPDRANPLQVNRTFTSYEMFGRLADGWSVERAHEEINAVHRQLATDYPDIDGQFAGMATGSMRSYLNFAYEPLQILFTFMLASVFLALVIACVNVASLSLARATSRSGEIAIRSSLGAGRGRIVRQLLTESVILASLGAVCGIGIATLTVRVVGPLIPVGLYRVGEATIDLRVLTFTVAVTLVTPLMFGLMPALTATRSSLNDILRSAGRGEGGGARHSMRVRRFLVGVEVAMAVVLVSVMGLMIRSFIAVQQIDHGFDPRSVVVVEVTPPAEDYPGQEAVVAYFDRLQEALGSVAGVQSVATVYRLPQNNETNQTQFARPGNQPDRPEGWPLAVHNRTGPNYFVTMDIPVMQGREFELNDVASGSVVPVIVSQELATQEWPNGDAVGQVLLWGEPAAPVASTVIGVVGEVKHGGVGEDERAHIYTPFRGSPTRRQFVVVRVDGVVGTAIPSLREAVLTIDRNLPFSLRTMQEVVDEKALPWSLSAKLLIALGVGALALAALGIYGIMAFSVAQRTREIGIRIALGASHELVAKGFLTEGVRLVMLGLTAGTVLTLIVGRVIRSLLYNVNPFDPMTLGVVLGIFVLVAVGASVVPARRASRTEPAVVLRHQ